MRERCHAETLHAGATLDRLGPGRKLVLLIATAACAVVVVAPARADSGMLFGFDDVWLLQNPTKAVTTAKLLGADGFRVPIYWQPGQTRLSVAQTRVWDPAMAAALGMRIVVVATGLKPRLTPKTSAPRTAYCTFVRSLLARYPTINDVVIWNEPNKSANWQPQFAGRTSVAPAAYEALLARCYDLLHAYRPNVNLLAPATSPNGNDDPRAVSNISHSPATFIAGIGRAYRNSGRRRPIFDNVAHHNYGVTPSERPWREHPGSMIAEGDWLKLVEALDQAFAGTAQPIPGRCVKDACASIWYLEAGYQTTIAPAKRRLYTASENVPRLVPPVGRSDTAAHPDANSPAPSQATQISDGARLAFCQPYVVAFFNYLLRDDADLRGWQSGAVWADGTPKPSFRSIAATIAEVHADRVNCARLKGGPIALATVSP